VSAVNPTESPTELHEPGWYAHPTHPSTVVYWDGDRSGDTRPAAWMMRKPESLWSLLGLGLLLSLFGALLFVGGFSEDDGMGLMMTGSALAIAGNTALLVAVVAMGVRLGQQHADWDRQNRVSDW